MGAGTGMCTSAARGTRGYPKEGAGYTTGAGGVSRSAEVRDLSSCQAVTGWETRGSTFGLWSLCLTQLPSEELAEEEYFTCSENLPLKYMPITQSILALDYRLELYLSLASKLCLKPPFLVCYQ